MGGFVLLIAAARAECPRPVSAEELGKALAVAESLDGDARQQALTWLAENLACVDVVLQPEVAGRIAVQLGGGEGGGAAGDTGEAEGQPLAVDAMLSLYVDGALAWERPGRNALYQVADRHGTVIYSAWLGRDEALPLGLAAPTEEPTVPADGRAELLDVAELLARGDYSEAVSSALVGVVAWPELAGAFQAAASVGTEQLRRQREGNAGGPTPADLAAEERLATSAPTADKASWTRRDGVDLGLPSGVRLEWASNDDRVLAAVGLRVGFNALFADELPSPAVDVAPHLDWRVSETVALRTLLGAVVGFDDGGVQVGAGLVVALPQGYELNLGARNSNAGPLPELALTAWW